MNPRCVAKSASPTEVPEVLKVRSEAGAPVGQYTKKLCSLLALRRVDRGSEFPYCAARD
jgi:hypothetical protein